MTVSSAFISSRRERIIFSVLSASGCAFKAAACVDVLRAVLAALGKTDLDNTDVARDHSFHRIANAESSTPADYTMHVGLTVSISSAPFPKFGTLVAPPPRHFVLQLPSGFRRRVEDRLNLTPVRKTQAGAGWSASLAA